MFFLKAAYCRLFQTAFRIAYPFLPYREPKLIGSCNELDTVLEKEGSRSVLIVTDKGIVSNGLTTTLEAVLKNNNINYVIYDETQPNPTVKNVEAAYKLYTSNKCDTLIAIGGGSSMDCAKAVGVRVVYPNKTLSQKKGILKVHRKLPTLIAIPTTAGTGSETTLATLITDTEKRNKYSLMSFPLIPDYAVLDASLTYTLPKHLTATTGMDALTHAVEAYIGGSTTKYTRRLSLDAIKLVYENIENAYINGTDHNARVNMLLASYKAGLAFSRSYVGYIHSIAHALGGRYGTPHGLANAVTMPYVLEQYGRSAQKKLHYLGFHVGVSNGNDNYALGAEKFISSIRELNKKMNIPEKLDDIKKKDIEEMASHAEREANPLYPVPKLMTKKELEAIFEKMMK